jgi:hypothetical protein
VESQGGKKLSRVVSTKLTTEDYDRCRAIARLCYINGTLKNPSVSELTRLALVSMLEKYRSPDLLRPRRQPFHPNFNRR